jgi:ribosomal protein S18 acetylase RimI-like enzyme
VCEPDDLGTRVADWYAEAHRAGASEATVIADGAWALRTPEYPQSFAQNAVLVRRDPGAEALIAWADEVLDGHHHRYVDAQCALSDETRAGLVAAGFELSALVHMARPAHDPVVLRREGAEVEPAEEKEIGRLHAVLWRTEWMPGISDDEVGQLVARRSFRAPGSTNLAWVVRDPELHDPECGDLAACVDLDVRGWAAEVDALATREAARGRGYGDALLAAAVAAAGEHGCTHAVLSALVEDWPREWYERRGFVTVGTAWEALRRVDGLRFASAGSGAGA